MTANPLRTFYLRYLNIYRNRQVDQKDIELCCKLKDGFTPWRCWTEVQNGYNWYLKVPELHRSILPNELVIELDDSELLKNLCAAKWAVKRLRAHNVPFWLFYSGNKGFHIHIFLQVGDIPIELAEEMDKRNDPDIWYAFRDYLAWRLVGSIRENFTVDSLKLRTPRTMIRTCGSLHAGSGFYKVHIAEPESLPTRLGDFAELQLTEPPGDEYYPEELAEWELDEWLPYLRDYLRKPRRQYRKRVNGGTRTSMPCLDYLLTHRLPDGRHRTVNLAAMRLKYEMDERAVLDRLLAWNQQLQNGHVRSSYIRAQVHYAFRYRGTLGCRFARSILKDIGRLDLCQTCEEAGGNG